LRHGPGQQSQFRRGAPASYLTGLSETINAVPLDAWKSYFNWRIVESYASYLNTDTVKQRFAFEGTVLRGVPQSEPRGNWRCATPMAPWAMPSASAT
jgi:predicted metalloendopeptidase